MRLPAAICCLLSLPVLLGTDRPAGFRHIAVYGKTAQVRTAPRLKVTVGPGFRRTGPHDFIKQEDNGYHFEVSLVSFVARRAVISIAAERLVEESALNYDDLPAASWPSANFYSRAKGCATLTAKQATQMPEASGMRWIAAAGFVPEGAFAFEAALLLAPDKRHEATIELIAPVASCTDKAAVVAALDNLRSKVGIKQ